MFYYITIVSCTPCNIAWNTCFKPAADRCHFFSTSRVGCFARTATSWRSSRKGALLPLLKADFGCRCSSHWCAELVPSTGTTSWSSGCAALLGLRLLPPRARAGRYIISFLLAVGLCTYVVSYVLELWAWLRGFLPPGDRAALCLDLFFELYDLVLYDLVLYDLVPYDLDFLNVDLFDLVLYEPCALDFIYLELCLQQLCLRPPQAQLALTPCATPTSQPSMGHSPSTESTDGESSSTWGRWKSWKGKLKGFSTCWERLEALHGSWWRTTTLPMPRSPMR